MIDQALRENRVLPAFQPIVDLKTGVVVAEEALARIVSPGGKSIPACAFIDAARELQLTHRIDQTILMQTFVHCVASLQRNQSLAHFVNISGNLLRHPDDKPTIGLLLCKGKDRLVVEYALRDFRKPIGVADWETQIVSSLPEELKGSLPTIEEIEAELEEG